MTTLGSLFGKSITVTMNGVDPKLFALLAGGAPLDLPALVASLEAIPTAVKLTGSLMASITAWINQDDDAHEPCSLTACRAPLHPGPCKGWKGILHSVSPGTFHQIEAERVKKANARRVKRIEDLRSQGKPIPRRLLTEIKPKPAPSHPAHGVQPVPLGKVNQQADLAAGQAHHSGQAISQAAGVKKSVAPPLPLGPKQKKPTVAGRGPAFVITQPKVTDTYKLDKAAKITPQEWDGLTPHDKDLIRNELTAIKARGFGPQQTRADALLAKLPAATTLKSGTPGTITTPKGNVHQVINPTPGKVTLGQATKVAPSSKDHHTKGNIHQAPTLADQVKAHQANRAAKTPTPAVPNGVDPVVQQVRKAQDPAAKLSPAARSFVYRKMDKKQFDALSDAEKKTVADDLDAQVAAHPGTASATIAEDLKQRFGIPDKAPAQSATTTSVTPLGARGLIKKHGSVDITYAKGTSKEKTFKDVGVDASHQHQLITKGAGQWNITDKNGNDLQFLPKQSGVLVTVHAPTAKPDGGIHPAAPLAPGTAAHIQHAAAVANRTAPKAQMAKTHLDTYDKLTKADFNSLPADQQKTIRDDLANAKAKFLDPKKQQAAGDLLNRFGSSHPTPAASTSAHPKGYSDPQHEVIKTAQGGDNGKFLQAVARISPATAASFDDGDRKQILSRLDFIATHPKATQEQKDKATAYGRIFSGGTHVPAGQKLDHAASIGELHAEEQKGGHAAVFAAVAAAQDKTMERGARVKALTALTKAQFDTLTPAEQRQVTDALHDLHRIKTTTLGSTSQLDPDVEKAFDTYTGLNPGIHRLKQAEADFRAGKLDAKAYDGFHKELLSARVQARGNAAKALQKEEQRVAEDNPNLPIWLRAEMIESKYNAPGGAYHSIAQASNPYNYVDAPRLSAMDMSNLFSASIADLASVHPIHAQAVKELREHVINTGLAPGSPWSTATKDHLVENLLHISTAPSDLEIPDERVKEFNTLPALSQIRVRRVLTDRIANQSNVHAKSGTYIAMRQLDAHDGPLTGDELAAVRQAADGFATPGDMDIYRKLSPDQFDDLPSYVQAAIKENLDTIDRRLSRGPSMATWSAQDNALKMFPKALAAHLDGSRATITDRRARNASDVANYGTNIISPESRVQAYGQVPKGVFDVMDRRDRNNIHDDLDFIAGDHKNPLGVQYNARWTDDVILGGQVGNWNMKNLTAVGAVNPTHDPGDAAVTSALSYIDKADFDSLDPVYQNAIDERIKSLPGPAQQSLIAKFHPGTQQTATPAGLTPTTVQANVPPHVQAALDTIYGVHASGKSHTMAHQLTTYGALRGSDFSQLNPQEQGHLLGDLSFIATTAKGPSADKARKLIDRFTPPGTPAGQVPTGAIIPPANALPGQTRYATPLKGLAKAKDSGVSGDGWYMQGGQRVWGKYGAAGLLLQHTDPQTGEKRYLMVQRGPAISDPGKWTFPGGASDSKETPHEGAARETIEELGLKDDVFKDAQVHGDFTYSIPGSTWKYTSVAASVPTMIKPDLSTAHARAETSDAKWLTAAEIQALDASGKLHHPIAGGKLDKNVISLFPQGTGQTLGQAVGRPGPVTKRQGRLHTPAGGRQAPGSANAWTAPHKPSKGKDLIGDKTAVDAQRQKIKQDRKLYDGKTADGRLAAIGAQQGFDDTPTVVPKAEIDRLLATGDYIEVFRGVSGAGGRNWRSGSSGGKTAAQINEEMRSGPAYYGKGIFGNGYYLATQKRVADQYADGTKGSIARMLIPKTAITKKYDEVEREAFKNPRHSKAKGGNSYESSTFYDPGRYAAAKGLDGIEIEPHHHSPGGGAGHVAARGKPAFNWLNRSVLIMQKEPG